MRVIENYIWFVANFFSITLLLRTLLSPWRRLSVSSGRGGEESFFGALLINTLMRGVGFLIRLITIFVGAFCLLFTMTIGFVAVLIWLVLPIAIFFLFFAGAGFVLSMLVKL